MQKHIKELYPIWTQDLHNVNRNLTMTDDLDSLISCAFLKQHFNLDINYFYSFHSISQFKSSDTRKSIGVDCALVEGLCFDNHLTQLNASSYINSQSANINSVTGVHRDRYTDKFAMSTLIQLWSLYDIPLPSTLEGKMILLCVDVGFKGYYSDTFRPTFLSFLEKFEMLELVEVLEAHTIGEMYDFMLRNELDLTIRRKQRGKNAGLLYFESSGNNPNLFSDGVDLDWISEHLGFSIELPKGEFERLQKFETKTVEWHEINTQMMNRAFSYAFINKNKAMISLREEN